jgi:cytochrome c oxidase subunit 2
MNKLIVLLVIVLGAIAIAQLMRVYDLISKVRNRREEVIPDRDNRLNATFLLLFMIGFFVSILYLFVEYGYTGRGDAASVHGVETDWLLNFKFAVIIGVFFLTNFLLFWFSYKYVRKPGVKAFYYPHNNKLELLWTGVPAFTLAIFVILGIKLWHEQTGPASDEAIRVELFAKQFDWTVRLSGDDNTLGNFDYKLTNDNNPLALVTSKSIQNAIDSMENGASGVKALTAKLSNPKTVFSQEDEDLLRRDLNTKEHLLRLVYQMQAKHKKEIDAAALDDIVFNASDTLFMCVDQDYEFNFRSKDIIHSAYFPNFRAQMNVLPGQTTRFKFTPSVTTKEMRKRRNNPQYNYALMCNKICGSSHYKMKLLIVVLDKEEYAKWYKKVSQLDPANPDNCRTFKRVYPVL